MLGQETRLETKIDGVQDDLCPILSPERLENQSLGDSSSPSCDCYDPYLLSETIV